MPIAVHSRLFEFMVEVDRAVTIHPSLGACWTWTGSVIGSGYGRCSSKFGSRYAHRALWILHRGQIPEGLFVCHSCDNPRCVNPSHLFTGTQKDNIADMLSKGRNGAKTKPEKIARGNRNGSRTKPERLRRGSNHHSQLKPECVARGERHGSAKVTEEDVREIRLLYAGGLSCGQLSKMFGITATPVGKIVNRITWKHVK